MQRIRRIYLLMCLMALVLMTGCITTQTPITHDQLVSLPAVILELKDNILLSQACAAIDGQPPLFGLGNVTYTFTAVVTRGGQAGVKPVIGIIPADLSATVSASRTQTLTINLIPLAYAEGETKITFKDLKREKLYLNEVTVVSMGGKLFVEGVKEGRQIFLLFDDILMLDAPESSPESLSSAEIEIKKKEFEKKCVKLRGQISEGNHREIQ